MKTRFDDMKRIAIIVTDITGIGGIERVTATLANELANQKNEVEILSLFKRNNSPVYVTGKGIKITYATNEDYNLQKSLLQRIQLLKDAFGAMKKWLKSSTSEVFIAQAFLPTFLMWLSGNIFRTTVCEHFKYELYGDGLMTKFRNWIYTKAKNVITLTDRDRKKFGQRGIDAVTIPNMNPFPIVEHKFSGKRIIAVGRLHPQKGFDILIRAMVKVNSLYPDWHLDIYGEGNERQNLEQLIHANDLSSTIALRGFCSDIQSQFVNSDIFVLSSRYEGFGMVILEALSSGTPVVSFDCPEGPESLLHDGSGILVSAENVDALANAIINVIGDTELRDSLRKNGYKTARKYSPEFVYEEWAKLLNKQG